MLSVFKKVFLFYYDGFKSMSVSNQKLWIIIGIKLFIMFAILKFFFFPHYLNSKFESEREKSNYVIEQLINKK